MVNSTMSSGSEAVNAVTECLNALVLQLVDTNQALAQIALHITYLAEHSNKLLDEIRTLNSAVARMEDFHYSAALKGSPSA